MIMEKRPLVKVDLVIKAVKTRSHKITVAMMHPKDMPNYDMDMIRLMLGGTEIIPSEAVERGMLYFNSTQLR